MKARKRKETGNGIPGGQVQVPRVLELGASGAGGVGQAVGGPIGLGDKNGPRVSVELPVERGEDLVVDGDFHLCETPQGERVAYRRDAVVAFRKGPYPGQVVVAVGGTTITVSQAPRILGSREQAERWVMR